MDTRVFPVWKNELKGRKYEWFYELDEFSRAVQSVVASFGSQWYPDLLENG